MTEDGFLLTLDDAPEDANLLGGKGLGLVRMHRQGFPVPPALIIPTDVCRKYMSDPIATMTEIDKRLGRVLDFFEKEFGHLPLLSVRSGSKFSMPGMMDTILNVGLTTKICVDDPWSTALRSKLQVQYKKLVGSQLPDNIIEQLDGAIEAILKSWNNPRAKTYREMNGIPNDIGTAVVLQAMVFGNKDSKSATLVAFSRDPATGEDQIVGEFLPQTQGEDLVSGTHTPKPLSDLPKWDKKVAGEVRSLIERLEVTMGDVQDVEMTIESGKVWLLQTRDAKRTGRAAIVIARDFYNAKLWSYEQVVRKVKLDHFLNARRPTIDPKFKTNPTFTGIPASPGIGKGTLVFSSAEAVEASKHGPVIMCTDSTSPDDLPGMRVSQAIITLRGGATCHAAVVARELNKPCIVGCGQLGLKSMPATVDGASGRVWVGTEVPVIEGDGTEVAEFVNMLRKHCPSVRTVLSLNEMVTSTIDVLVPIAHIFSPVAPMMEAIPPGVKVYLDLSHENLNTCGDDKELLNCFGEVTTNTAVKGLAAVGMWAKKNDVSNIFVLPFGLTKNMREEIEKTGLTVLPLVHDIETLVDAEGTVVVSGLKGSAIVKKILALKKKSGTEVQGFHILTEYAEGLSGVQAVTDLQLVQSVLQ